MLLAFAFFLPGVSLPNSLFVTALRADSALQFSEQSPQDRKRNNNIELEGESSKLKSSRGHGYNKTTTTKQTKTAAPALILLWFISPIQREHSAPKYPPDGHELDDDDGDERDDNALCEA